MQILLNLDAREEAFMKASKRLFTLLFIAQHGRRYRYGRAHSRSTNGFSRIRSADEKKKYRLE